MNDQQVANQILQDVLSLPGAEYLAQALATGNKYSDYRSAKDYVNWMLTGEYPKEHNTYLQKTIDDYIKDKIEGIRHAVFRGLALSKDISAASRKLLHLISERPDVDQIIHQAKVRLAMKDIAYSSDIGDAYAMSNFLLEGDDQYGYYVVELILNPGKADQVIVDRFNLYLNRGKAVHYLWNMIEMLEIPRRDKNEIEQKLAMMNEREKVIYLLEIFSEYTDPEDFNLIFNYFNPPPSAPEAPSAKLI